MPVTIKESFAYRGSPNTWGLPSLADAHSPRTAIAVERLEAAGAIVVGKTNVPVMALGRAGVRMEQDWPAGIDLQSQMKTFAYLLFSLVTAAIEPHARWLQETRRRLACRALWQKYFERHDVFLLPTAFTAAFPHDHSELLDNRTVSTPEGPRHYARDMGFWISAATRAGLPATVAPVGRTRDGLPVGLQIIVPMWEDGTSIEFAALVVGDDWWIRGAARICESRRQVR